MYETLAEELVGFSRTRAGMLGDYSSLKGWEWSPFGMGSGWRRVRTLTEKQVSKPVTQGGDEPPPPPKELPKDKMAELLEGMVLNEPEVLPPTRYGTCLQCCISVDVAAFEGRCSICGRSLSFR